MVIKFQHIFSNFLKSVILTIFWRILCLISSLFGRIFRVMKKRLDSLGRFD